MCGLRVRRHPHQRVILLHQTPGEFIRRHRKALGLRVEDLANRINMSRSAVLGWEHDRRIPNRRYALALSAALEVDQDELARVIIAHVMEDPRADALGRHGWCPPPKPRG